MIIRRHYYNYYHDDPLKNVWQCLLSMTCCLFVLVILICESRWSILLCHSFILLPSINKPVVLPRRRRSNQQKQLKFAVRMNNDVKNLHRRNNEQHCTFSTKVTNDNNDVTIQDDNNNDTKEEELTTTTTATLRSVTFCNLSKDQEPDLLCDYLLELGACSTSIIDADRNTEYEVPIFSEPSSSTASWNDSIQWATPIWNHCSIIAHFPASINIPQTIQILQETFPNTIPDINSIKQIPNNKDWIVHVQQSWPPIIVANKFILRFPWHTDTDITNVITTEQNNKNIDDFIQIKLQGGIAFGTGEHATTQLCLEWLHDVMLERLSNLHDDDDDSSNTIRVLDYGSGSGILGIAACVMDDSTKRNRVSAIGIDIDIDACYIANENSKLNNNVNMKSYLPPLMDTTDNESKSLLLKAHNHAKQQIAQRKKQNGVTVLDYDNDDLIYNNDSNINESFDICVANILANPLIVLAPTLYDMIKSGAPIGMSGILKEQGENVVKAYKNAGFINVQIAKEMDGWVLVTGQKP